MQENVAPFERTKKNYTKNSGQTFRTVQILKVTLYNNIEVGRGTYFVIYQPALCCPSTDYPNLVTVLKKMKKILLHNLNDFPNRIII